MTKCCFKGYTSLTRCGAARVITSAAALCSMLTCAQRVNAVESTWSGGSGTWSVAGNWVGPVPNSADAGAVFGAVAGSTTTVSVDGTFQLRLLRFAMGNGYRLQGGTLSLSQVVPSMINLAPNAMGAATLGTSLQLGMQPLEVLNSSALQTMSFDGSWFGTSAVSLAGPGIELRGNRLGFGGSMTVLGSVTAFTAGSLGPDSTDVRVSGGGSLTLRPELTSNSIAVAPGGALRLDAPIYSGAISLLGGTSLSGTGTLQGNLSVAGKANSVANLRLARVTGSGDLNLQNVRIVGPIEHTGLTAFSTGTIEAQGSYLGGIRVTDQLDVRAMVSTPTLTVGNGTLSTSAGGQIAAGNLVWHGSVKIAADLTDTARVQKASTGTAEIPVLTNFKGELNALRGRMFINDLGLGNNVASISVSPGNASLRIRSGQTLTNPVFLKNAHGTIEFSALYGETFGNSRGTIAGAVHVGDIGSTIGGQFRISGPVSGGSLDMTPTSIVALSNPTNVFAGEVRTTGRLELTEAGRLTASMIRVRGGQLALENFFSANNVTDRIPDSVPIRMEAGTVVLRVPSDASTSERIGSIHIEGGTSTLSIVSAASGGTQGEWIVGTLSRNPGAVMVVNTSNSGELPGGRFKVRVQSQLPLNDGMIGGWAYAGRFLSQNADGLVPLQSYFTGNINNAAANANVEFSSANATALTGDLTINSLTASVPVNLNGHTLTVDTGGIIGGGSFGNGTLRPGAASRELFLHLGGVSITCEIADGPAGPTDVIVPDTANLSFSAANSYTGKLYVHGQAIIQNPAAIPPGTDVMLNEGALVFSMAPTPAMQFGKLHMSGNSILQTPNWPIVAEEIRAETGTVTAQFTGSAPFVKNGPGQLRLVGNSPNWNGSIEVTGGELSIGWSPSAPLPAGTGVITVGSGAALSAPQVSNPVVLAGGVLASIGTGPITVIADSSIQTASQMTVIENALTIQPNASLRRIGGTGTVVFSGDVVIKGAIEDEFDGFLVGTSGLILRPLQGRTAAASGTFNGSISLGGGGAVSPGDSVGILRARSAFVGFSGGILNIDVAAATGTPGIEWDLLDLESSLDFRADTASMTIRLFSVGGGGPAPLPGFDPNTPYTWQIIDADAVVGNTIGRLRVDPSAFLAQNPGAAIGAFSAFAGEDGIYVRYVPEPATLGFLTVVGMMMGKRGRYRCPSLSRTQHMRI